MDQPLSLRLLAQTLAAGDRATFNARLSSALAVHSTPFERTLVLHIGAAAAAVARDLAALEKYLAEAAELEAADGLRVGSQHTLHQLALFGNHQGDLRSVSSYYRATATTLRGQKNTVGMALCYRSLGEILLALGKIPETLRYWSLAEQALRLGQCPEADQLGGWIAALSAPEAAEAAFHQVPIK